MTLSNIKTVEQYQQLIKFLKVDRLKSNKLLLLIVCLFWMMGGCIRTLSDTLIYLKSQQKMPVVDACQSVGVITITSISMVYNRRKVNLCCSFLTLIAALIIAIIIKSQESSPIIDIFLYLIFFLNQGILLNILSALLQTFSRKYYSKIMLMIMVCYYIGNAFSLFFSQQIRKTTNLRQYLLIIISILYVVGSFLFKQTLFYWLQHDLWLASDLIQHMARQNNCDMEELLNMPQNKMIWINMQEKKINLNTFYKYPSLSYHTYFIILCFFGLGCIGKIQFQAFKFLENSGFNALDEKFGAVWDMFYQILSFIPCSNLFSAIVVFVLQMFHNIRIFRSINIITLCMVLLVYLILIFQISKVSLMVVFGCLGIISFLNLWAFMFLMINIFQFYPFTIRTLAMGLMLAVLDSSHIAYSSMTIYLKSQILGLEIGLWGALLLSVNSFFIKQTYLDPLKYEIKEIMSDLYEHQ